MEYIPWIRSKVGSRKIFMVAGTMVVQDEDGRILLQRRADFDVWALPGGALELDEDIETCARRELWEETGLRVGDLRLIGVYSHPKYDVLYPNGDQIQQFNVCFAGQWTGGTLQADESESRDLKFFAPDEIPWEQMPVWYTDVLHDFFQDTPPRFLPPFENGRVDQIKAVRPFIGTDLYIGVGAMMMAVRADGRILMIRRADTGTWMFPGGYADLGENVANTAVRETFEETGFHVQVERLAGVYSSHTFHHTFANGDEVKNVGVLFRGSLLDGKAHPQPNEVSDIAWMLPEEILSHSVGSRYQPFIENALAYMEQGYFLM